jgi:hypothetical protein
MDHNYMAQRQISTLSRRAFLPQRIKSVLFGLLCRNFEAQVLGVPARSKHELTFPRAAATARHMTALSFIAGLYYAPLS